MKSPAASHSSKNPQSSGSRSGGSSARSGQRSHTQGPRNLNDLFDEIDWDRVRMGRFSDADERVMEQIVSSKGARLWVSFGRGRYHSDLRQAGFSSSRPRTDTGGETFAFRHDTVSKRREREIPKDRIYVTPKAGVSMKAIEASPGVHRDPMVSIGARSVGWYVREASDIPAQMQPASVKDIAPRALGQRPGAAARRQRYIERDDAVEETAAGQVSSTGNIGNDMRSRTDFWNAVEAYERANGRIQSSIIAELPFEAAVGAEGRQRIIQDFGAKLGALGLRWHGVVHEPEEHSDARNYHMHMVYHDRPATLDENGVWQFDTKKLSKTREYGFVRELREEFANSVNVELARAGLDRHLDPRRYEEMGISKRPGEHLGAASHALEMSGIVTTKGARNVGIESEFQLLQSLVSEAGILERDLSSVRSALDAAAELSGSKVPRHQACIQTVLEAATALSDAARERAVASARVAWANERSLSMRRRPHALSERGRDEKARSEASDIVISLDDWWSGEKSRRGQALKSANTDYRHARRALERAEREVFAEALLSRRARTLSELKAASANAGKIDVMSDAWRSETLMMEQRLKKLQGQRYQYEMTLGIDLKALNLDVTLDLSRRGVRRRLREELCRRAGVSDLPGAVFMGSESSTDLGKLLSSPDDTVSHAALGLRSLDALDQTMSALRKLEGSLRLRKRTEQRVDRERLGKANARAREDRKEAATLVASLRRRVDAVDHIILNTPVARSLAERRGIMSSLLKEGALAHANRRKEQSTGRET